jgi:hypothetical protein
MRKKKARTAEQAPFGPNPLKSWKRLGAVMLNCNLWPGEYRYNPLVVYITGRQRGWLLEDILAFIPWGSVFLLNAFLLTYLIHHNEIEYFFLAYFIQLLILPSMAALSSAILVTFHFRRLANRLPVEELLMTRMEPEEIVQGISIRPLSTLSFSLIFYTLAMMALLIPAYIYPGRRPHDIDMVSAFVSMVMMWYILGSCHEVGAALALRSQLYIRSGWGALCRCCIDWFFCRLGFPIIFWLLINYGVVMIFGSGGAMVFLTIVMGACGEFVNNGARQIMADCARYPDQWWMIRRQRYHDLCVPWMKYSWRKIFVYLDAYEKAYETNSYIFRTLTDADFGRGKSPRQGPRPKGQFKTDL